MTNSKQPSLNTDTISTPCPICNYSIVTTLFNGGYHPLATLGWPTNSKEAREMQTFPQNYVQCPKCTHVWNHSFVYDAIPYQNNPNRMFNTGSIWKGHLAYTRNLVLSLLPETPTVIDIGCGEGHFVRGLAEVCNYQGRFIGFDPNTTSKTGAGLEFYPRYFEPLIDTTDFAPDIVVMRHVLEHLTQPTIFLEQLAWSAAISKKNTWLFAEVPCIDRVFETFRLADFFYEHPSQFTSESFRKLMEKAGEITEFAHGYDGEVVYSLVRLTTPKIQLENAIRTTNFLHQSYNSRTSISKQLNDLAKSDQRVAIWGGTGKAAAFIHQYNVDSQRFPLVVDSDPDKIGTFVPETGQEIIFRDILKSSPVDIVIIPTQWRAKDILTEMNREGIVAKLILIEHKGQLINFLTDKHPYKGTL
jgi:hypothetical protein